MSCTNGNVAGPKVLLPRRPERWQPLFAEFAGDDAARWKILACYSLHSAGWTQQMIAQVFGHDRGHVARLIDQARSELERHFTPVDDPRRDLAGAGEASTKPHTPPPKKPAIKNARRQRGLG